MWKPNFNKYLIIFQREYNIPRNEILQNYSWDDIQNYIHDLPIERVITLYEGKKANNKERYLEALCDRDIDGGISSMNAAAANFEERLNKAKEIDNK